MIKKITYEYKIAIQNDETIPRKNKVTAEDMNEIKETINANADELENYTVEIVRLRNDLQASQLTSEESGENIDLNDSSNARFHKFEIYGNHKQETRIGKNHFFTSTSSSTTNGITYAPQTDKSSIIANGTATSNATKWLIVDAAQFKLEAGSYVLSSCGTCDNSIYIGLGGKTSSGAEKFNITEKGTAVSFNIDEGVYLNCYIQTVSGTQTKNKLIKIMIVKAGVDYQNYESYGAMPSPAFPSKIKTIKDNAEIKVTNNDNTQIQTITMPVQQEMLQGDYFDCDNEKEVHKWEKLILTGDEDYTNPQTNLYNLGNLNKKSTPNLNLIILQCNKYKAVKSVNTNNEFLNENADVDYACGFHTNQTEIRIKDARFSSLTEFKNNIKQQYDAGTPVIIYYKTATPTELDFTDEQKAVAKQIKETLHTYKNVTHIYSDDEVSPVIDVEYAKDLNTVINNIQAQDK